MDVIRKHCIWPFQFVITFKPYLTTTSEKPQYATCNDHHFWVQFWSFSVIKVTSEQRPPVYNGHYFDVLGSISSTFYNRLFRTKVFWAAFLYLQFSFVSFWQKLLIKCWWNWPQNRFFCTNLYWFIFLSDYSPLASYPGLHGGLTSSSVQVRSFFSTTTYFSVTIINIFSFLWKITSTDNNSFSTRSHSLHL